MSQEDPSSYRTSFDTTPEKELQVRNQGSAEMRLAKTSSSGEEYIERHDGDDIHKTPSKEFQVGGTNHVRSEGTVDANKITWDGPNDPLNPQNWSIKYKWWVMVVCTIMTINVYV